MHDQLNKAIADHSIWKAKLSKAIKGGELPNLAATRADNRCGFGQWLAEQQLTRRGNPHFEEVKSLHTQFHRQAADVLTAVQRGQQKEAEASMALGGKFIEASTALTRAIMEWKRAG